ASPLEALRNSALGKRLLDGADTLFQTHLDAYPQRKDAARINHDVLEWLSQRAERPFFVFLNYYDAHDPYLLPAGFDRHFGLKPETPSDHVTLCDWHKLDKLELPPRHRDLGRDAYDDCIAYLDDQLGRLLDELDRRGLLRDTLVIITSDHGENLGEHQLYGHA